MATSLGSVRHLDVNVSVVGTSPLSAGAAFDPATLDVHLDPDYQRVAFHDGDVPGDRHQSRRSAAAISAEHVRGADHRAAAVAIPADRAGRFPTSAVATGGVTANGNRVRHQYKGPPARRSARPATCGLRLPSFITLHADNAGDLAPGTINVDPQLGANGMSTTTVDLIATSAADANGPAMQSIQTFVIQVTSLNEPPTISRCPAMWSNNGPAPRWRSIPVIHGGQRVPRTLRPAHHRLRRRDDQLPSNIYGDRYCRSPPPTPMSASIRSPSRSPTTATTVARPRISAPAPALS